MQLNLKKLDWAMISLNPFLFVPIYNIRRILSERRFIDEYPDESCESRPPDYAHRFI